jgi:hypothetical protein
MNRKYHYPGFAVPPAEFLCALKKLFNIKPLTQQIPLRALRPLLEILSYSTGVYCSIAQDYII